MGWKKNQEVVLFHAVDLKIFPIPQLSRNIWETALQLGRKSKQNAQDETEGEREKKREGEEERRRESKQEEGTTQAEVPLLTYAPICHYGIYKPAALLDAKHP